jgi:mRNA interferase RelE/StbE
VRHRVELAPAAQRQLQRVRGPALMALRGAILGLREEPRPAGARKLSGTDDLARIRLRIDGQPWRVVYQLRPAARLVIVLRVARRDEATYRRL